MDGDVSTDNELVEKALKERQAFSSIVERYEKPLSRYTRRLGADPEAVKDILQETFIKVYVNLNGYDADFSFSTWMYRIAHNEAVNYWRKARVRPSAFHNEEDLELFSAIPDKLDLMAEVNDKERAHAVRESLAQLPDLYREIFVLRYLEEKSYDEISDILQMPPGTVATHLNRGKEKLKKLLKENKTLH